MNKSNIPAELRYRMFLDRFRPLRSLRDGMVCLRWASRQGGAPFPPAVKRALLRDLAKKYRLSELVETGTFLGDTSAEMAAHFDRVYTVEAAQELFAAVAPRFAKLSNVHRFYGDSGVILNEIVPRLSAPALFWLDAHVQGFAQAGELNPIIREVLTVVADQRHRHVLAIDDMRLFGAASEYPTIEELRAALGKTGRQHQFTIAGDIGVVCLE
jgi:hypothetical protein